MMPLHEVVGLRLRHQTESYSNAGHLIRSIADRIHACLRSGDEQGGSLIEFALCLPPLFILVTGVVALGIAFINYGLLNNAASVAAQQLSISRGQLSAPSYDPCALVVSYVESSAGSLKPASLTFSTVINGTTYAGTSCTSTSQSTGAAGTLLGAQGKPIAVTVTYPCDLTAKFYGTNGYLNCTLTATMSEVVQ
jgi:Flp pilus assembly protein TadG